MSSYQIEAIKIAKDFHYPQSVIDAIKSAKNEIQIGNILHDARIKYL